MSRSVRAEKERRGERRRRVVDQPPPAPSSASTLLLLLFLLLGASAAGAQEIAAAFGDNNPNVVRREYVEYDPAPGGRRGHHRQAGPFDGVVPGFAALGLSSWLLWWNEGRHVRDARMLRRAEKSVVVLGLDDDIGNAGDGAFDPANEGKLVHVSGQLRTEGIVDTTFGLDRPDSLRLRRDTDAYQWLEKRTERKTRINEKQSRVEVTYRYSRDWSKRRVDSARFERSAGHENPAALRMDPGVEFWTVSDATLPNGLHVPPQLLDAKLGGFQPVGLGEGRESSSILPPYENAVIFGSKVYLPDDAHAQLGLGSDESSPSSNRKSNDGIASTSHSSTRSMAVARASPRPAVGDIRISWSEVPSPRRGVSILARQEGDTLVPWTDDSTGHSLYALVEASVPPHLMIRQLRETSQRHTWILRAVGWLGNFLGFKMVLSCIPYIVGRVPLYIGRLLEPIADLATSFVAAGGSIGLSAAVLSVAWLRFRPEFAVVLAACSTGAFYAPLLYSKWKRKSSSKERPTVLIQEAGLGTYNEQEQPA